ncbi:hypothetical protein E3Q23_02951 [Wallemia mellicola]|nr:hypothetical protein E3Q23_02951 [Wallemia mellicola]
MDQYKKLKENGMHFNDKLQQSQQFHNPHINAKLISWVGVDEDSSAAAIAAKQRERSTEKANTSSKRTNISFTNAKANKSRKQ